MFESYYRELLNFLARKVSDRSVASDLTQESYARVYAARVSGSIIGDPRALLYRTARNLLIDHRRHSDVRAAVELPSEQADASESSGPRTLEPDTALASHQGVSALVAAIGSLPPRCREAFMLNRFEGRTYAEVAARMGISVKMVEQHIKHALDACERCRAASAGDVSGTSAPRRKLNRSQHE